MKSLILKLLLAVLLLLAAGYAAANIVYNLPEECYPDPIETAGSRMSDVTAPIESGFAEPETEPISPMTDTEPASETVETSEPATAPVTETAAPETEYVAVTQPVIEAIAETTVQAMPEETQKLDTEPEVPADTGEASEADEFLILAETLIGDKVKEALELVRDAELKGSAVTFPYEPRYEREMLTPSQQAYYDELLEAVSLLEPFAYSSECIGEGGISDVKEAFEALRLDNPRFSYYVRLEQSEGDGFNVLESHYFLPSDNNVTVAEDKTALLYDVAVFDAVCRYIVDRIPEEFSAYDKYRYLASVVSLCTVYDHHHDVPFVHDTPYGPIMDGLAICTGYTTAFQYLCELADLYCVRTYGATYGGLVHMWNVVKLESGTYHVDVTWSDSDRNTPCKRNWQTYFMLTQKRVLVDHVISDGTVATGTENFD